MQLKVVTVSSQLIVSNYRVLGSYLSCQGYEDVFNRLLVYFLPCLARYVASIALEVMGKQEHSMKGILSI